MSRKRSVSDIVVLILLIFGAFIMFMPYWFMVILSFETPEETASVPPHLIPHNPTMENYRKVFIDMNFGLYSLNTAFVAGALVVAQVLFCSMAGYAFARLAFPFRRIIFLIFLSVMMLPTVVIIIPRYLLLKNLHLINTLSGVILLEIFSAFGIFLYRQHFLSLPIELEEAAVVDGASVWQIFWKIVMPLSKNITMSFGLLVFIYGWNLFLWPLIVLTSPEKRTLPIALAMLQGRYFGDWGAMMAGAVVAAVPPIILFILAQKSFIRGIAFGGFK